MRPDFELHWWKKGKVRSNLRTYTANLLPMYQKHIPRNQISISHFGVSLQGWGTSRACELHLEDLEEETVTF